MCTPSYTWTHMWADIHAHTYTYYTYILQRDICKKLELQRYVGLGFCFETVLLCSTSWPRTWRPGCPWTRKCLCLPIAGIKGIQHHAQPSHRFSEGMYKKGSKWWGGEMVVQYGPSNWSCVTKHLYRTRAACYSYEIKEARSTHLYCSVLIPSQGRFHSCQSTSDEKQRGGNRT